METINIVLFSRDKDYCLALGEAISGLKNNFIIRICEDAGELPACGFDLLISDESGDSAIESFKGDKRVIRMTDSRSDAVSDVEAMEFVLYKYSGARKFTADISLYYSLLTGKRNVSLSAGSSRIVVFCGGKGGVGKTTVALGAAQALRRHYAKSVLYVSLEEVESTPLYMRSGEGTQGLCEYLYHLFKTDDKRPDSEAFMIYDRFGTAAFMPDGGRNRLRELDSEKLTAFFNRISEGCTYDYILVDTGEIFGEELRWLTGACDKVVAVLSPNGALNAREGEFMKYLRFTVGGDADERLITVCNKVTEGNEDEEDGGSVYIDFDNDSIDASGGIIEISIDRDFGSGIKRLTKKLM